MLLLILITTFLCSYSLTLQHNSIKKLSSTNQIKKEFTVGVIGATGAVGNEIINCLHYTKFPVSELKLYSSKSTNKVINTPFGRQFSYKFDIDDAKKCDIIFLAVSGDFSKQYAKQLSDDDTIVIDNSSAFRYDNDVPLVIPEINTWELKGKKLIANPNCTTAIALMALFPIFKLFGLSKVIMSTYQAASGAGNKGMEDLKESIKKKILYDKTPDSKIFSYPLAFNVIPHIDEFQDNGYTKEEMKVTWETKKILNAPDMKISCTAVRIPTLRAHSEAITLELSNPANPDDIRTLLSSSRGVKVVDDIENKLYPMPLNSAFQYDIEVGRIRRNDVFDECGIDLFVSGDQLLRGAALNAVIIAEEMVKME